VCALSHHSTPAFHKQPSRQYSRISQEARRKKAAIFPQSKRERDRERHIVRSYLIYREREREREKD